MAVAAAKVTRVSKFEPGASVSTTRVARVSLDDAIAVEASELRRLDTACGSRLVLFLNGHPIKSLRPSQPSDPDRGRLLFKLTVSDGATVDGQDDVKKAEEIRKAWIAILGQPHLSSRHVDVSIGPDDVYPLESAAVGDTCIDLDIVDNKWLLIWGALFLLMVGAFWRLARCSNIIREGNPTPAPGSSLLDRTQFGPYSLSKTQGAWWFFIIIASYLFIGMITGDFSSSVNSTALILLGIGAGTVVASALIDKSKEAQDAPKVENAKSEKEITLTKLDADLEKKDAALRATAAAAATAAADAMAAAVAKAADAAQLAEAAASAAAAKSALEHEVEKLRAQRNKTLSDYRKLTQQNEWFLTDILSDADGVSFHRFQMLGWTVVLGLVFVKDVYYTLAMPVFDGTLLGLLGLSASTYLGLKIPEPTTPKK